MATTRGSYTVTIAGHREFLRLLRSLEPAVAREATSEIREVVREIAVDARILAPKRHLRLAKSIGYSATLRGASVWSSVPYAPPHEFGGTVWLRTYDVRAPGMRLRPRKKDGQLVPFRPVRIAEARFMRSAAEKEGAFRAERYAAIIDSSLKRL